MWHVVGFLWSRRHHSEESEEKRNAVLMCGNCHKNCPPMYVPGVLQSRHWHYTRHAATAAGVSLNVSTMSVKLLSRLCARLRACARISVSVCACVCVHVCLLHLLTARQPVQHSNVRNCISLPFPVTSVAYKRQARHSLSLSTKAIRRKATPV